MVNQPPKEPKVAIIGGGLTGLTSAYYLAAKYLPESKIAIYEGSDRVGGWIRSESKEVDVNGQKQTVMFERGPRAMSPGDMIHDQQDRLVLYDLVRFWDTCR
jgi:oxygen-dependent protoporphyrinogen oxidase